MLGITYIDWLRKKRIYFHSWSVGKIGNMIVSIKRSKDGNKYNDKNNI